jgi:cytochrome o ubiquinol oxidase subunit 2
MHFDVRVVAADTFAAWIDSTRQAGLVLDAAAYTTLETPSVNPPAMSYRSVDEGLFQRIVTQSLPPAPGPARAGGR